MIPIHQVDHIACQLLKFEQQLKAYAKLHEGELAELWQTLNDCKQTLADIVSANESPGSAESNGSEETDRDPVSVATTNHA